MIAIAKSVASTTTAIDCARWSTVSARFQRRRDRSARSSTPARFFRSDAARIDWGTIVLFGTGIIFGTLLEETGLAETIGKGSSDALGLSSTIAITAFAIVLAILVSETTSAGRTPACSVPRTGSRSTQITSPGATTW